MNVVTSGVDQCVLFTDSEISLRPTAPRTHGGRGLVTAAVTAMESPESKGRRLARFLAGQGMRPLYLYLYESLESSVG